MPQELYETPRNRFVAGFIGSPSMNFADLRIERDGGSLRLAADGTEVRLDEVQAALLRQRRDDSITVGFRPEHLVVGAPDGPGLKLSADIDVIEFLGNDSLIHAASDGRDVVAIVNADNGLKVGDRVVLHAAPKSLYLFDPATGLSLAPS